VDSVGDTSGMVLLGPSFSWILDSSLGGCLIAPLPMRMVLVVFPCEVGWLCLSLLSVKKIKLR